MLFRWRRKKESEPWWPEPTVLDQRYMNDFGPTFAEKLNQYNHEHENFPFIFYFGKQRLDTTNPYPPIYKTGGIRAILEDVPEDIRNALMNDLDHPDQDEYSIGIGFLREWYFEEYLARQDDPDIYAKLVPHFFKMEVYMYATRLYKLKPRFQRDPLHRVYGSSTYRHYQDPVGVRRDIFGQEVASALRGDVDWDAKPDA